MIALLVLMIAATQHGQVLYVFPADSYDRNVVRVKGGILVQHDKTVCLVDATTIHRKTTSLSFSAYNLSVSEDERYCVLSNSGRFTVLELRSLEEVGFGRAALAGFAHNKLLVWNSRSNSNQLKEFGAKYSKTKVGEEPLAVTSEGDLITVSGSEVEAGVFKWYSASGDLKVTIQDGRERDYVGSSGSKVFVDKDGVLILSSSTASMRSLGDLISWPPTPESVEMYCLNLWKRSNSVGAIWRRSVGDGTSKYYISLNVRSGIRHELLPGITDAWPARTSDRWYYAKQSPKGDTLMEGSLDQFAIVTGAQHRSRAPTPSTAG